MSVLLALLLMAEPTLAYTHPANVHTTWDLSQKTFGSAESAAIEGLRASYKADNTVEYGGVVVMLPGHIFRYTVPVTSGYKAGVNLPGDYTLTLPFSKEPTLYVDDLPVVADFHTHPCYHQYLTDHFSPPDLARNNAYGIDGYILDGCLGDVYRYDPHKDTQTVKKPWKGHVVAWIKEVAE